MTSLNLCRSSRAAKFCVQGASTLDSLVQRRLEAREAAALPLVRRDALAVRGRDDLVVDGRERPDGRVGDGLRGQRAELVADDVVREVVHVLRAPCVNALAEALAGRWGRTRSFLS